MHPDIDRAITDLYIAFAVPRPLVIEGCDCCATEDELRTLIQVPLRDLNAAQLEGYAFSALLTVGGAYDLPYFWPRLVELAARGELLTDREILFKKPPMADWRAWPGPQQRATEQFVVAQLSDFARVRYYRPDVDSWVCAFSLLLGDVTPFLTPLLQDTEPARANLLKLHSWNMPELERGTLTNAFWEECPSASRALIDWFQRSEVRAAIQRAYQMQGLDPEDSAV